MFYIFIIFFAIVTIVVYRLQKNLDKGSPLEGQREEKTASLDTEEEEQADNQDVPPILSTTAPQTIPPPEQQTEVSTVRHLSTNADVTEIGQNDTPIAHNLASEENTGQEHQEIKPASRKLTPKEIVIIFAGALYMLIAFTLMEMDHPLWPALMGVVVIGFIVWFIRMPKEQWAQLRAIAKEADEREARSPFRKAVKVIGVSIVVAIILIIFIEFFGKYL